MACKLYLKMRIREATVEEQIQWVLMYVQEESGDIWKKNAMKDLEVGVLEYETIGEFLDIIRKEFGGEDDKSKKMAELKELEQEEKMMEEFV